MSRKISKNTFREHLVSIRKEKFKDKAKAARAAGIPYSTYLNYEKETNPIMPTVENLAKIKNGWNISFEKLFQPFLNEVNTEVYDLIERVKKICSLHKDNINKIDGYLSALEQETGKEKIPSERKQALR